MSSCRLTTNCSCPDCLAHPATKRNCGCGFCGCGFKPYLWPDYLYNAPRKILLFPYDSTEVQGVVDEIPFGAQNQLPHTITRHGKVYTQSKACETNYYELRQTATVVPLDKWCGEYAATHLMGHGDPKDKDPVLTTNLWPPNWQTVQDYNTGARHKNIGWAICHMKDGKTVKRGGWVKGKTLKYNDKNVWLGTGPHFSVCVDGSALHWTPTLADLLAVDWELI